QCLWRIEKGKAQPKLTTVRAIERVLEDARNGIARHKGGRLYPRKSKSAKARLRKTMVPKRPRGRPTKEQTQELNGFCYRRYFVDGQQASAVMEEVNCNPKFAPRHIFDEKQI